MSVIVSDKCHENGGKMRQELLDKGIVFACGFLSLYIIAADEAIVIASLLAIIITLLPNIKFGVEKCDITYLVEFFGILYILAGIKWLVCFPFYPLIAYDFFKKKRYIVIGGIFAILMYYLLIAQNLYSDVESIDKQKEIFIYTILLLLISLRLSFVSQKRGILTEKIKKMRDDNQENENFLKERNKILLEQQNVEIRMATLKERNRIAREIHDNVGHMLTRAILQTGALKVLEKEEKLKEQLNDLQQTLNVAMNNIRNSVHDLHDDSINLEKAVKELIMAFPKLDIDFEYEVENQIDKNIKYGFLAIIKEALTNTLKHSNGNKVRIEIVENPGFYKLVVTDNGTEIQENFVGGMGISSIQERVETLNGVLRISTDNGFRITITIFK